MRMALVLAAALLVPLASGGSQQAPEVVDAAGDTAAFGAPAPAGFAWADLRSAWFERDGDRLRLTIQVGEGAGAPPVGEVGVTFRVGGQHYIAGYTVVPGLYSGGFLSLSDANGDVPSGVSPDSVEGTFADGTVMATFPLASVAGPGNATSLSDPWGWSESRATNGETYRLDRTGVGSAFSWAGAEGRPSGTPAEGARDIPAAAAGLLLALAVSAAWSRRR